MKRTAWVWGLFIVMLLVPACGGDDELNGTTDGNGAGASGADGAGGTGTGEAGGGEAGSGEAGGGEAGSGEAGGGEAGSGEAGSGVSGPSLQEIPALLAEAMCETVIQCLGADTVTRAYGEGNCVDRVVAGLEDGDFQLALQAVDEGRVTYNADRVEPCLAAIASVGCDLDSSRFFSKEACGEVLVGSLSAGDNCSVDVECAGSAFCQRADSGDGCPGICTDLLAAGQQCSENDQCQDGLHCSELTGTCAQPAGPDQACEGNTGSECKLGLQCVGADEDTGTAGVCKTQDQVLVGSSGDACDFDTGMLCQKPLSCIIILQPDAVIFQCAPPVGSGQSCNFGAPGQCPLDEYCSGIDLQQPVVEGVCQPLPGAGEPCIDERTAPPCAPGLVCETDGRCRTLGRLDDPCLSDEGCASEYCRAGLCARPAQCEL